MAAAAESPRRAAADSRIARYAEERTSTVFVEKVRSGCFLDVPAVNLPGGQHIPSCASLNEGAHELLVGKAGWDGDLAGLERFG